MRRVDATAFPAGQKAGFRSLHSNFSGMLGSVTGYDVFGRRLSFVCHCSPELRSRNVCQGYCGFANSPLRRFGHESAAPEEI